jgi:hypothetical protein
MQIAQAIERTAQADRIPPGSRLQIRGQRRRWPRPFPKQNPESSCFISFIFNMMFSKCAAKNAHATFPHAPIWSEPYGCVASSLYAYVDLPERAGNMFASFEYSALPLDSINLDVRNPRIVTQSKLASQEAIVKYLFEHERLASFIKKVSHEGKNKGAERPYVVKSGKGFTVIEGNTRIAAYKLLAGLIIPPAEYASAVPSSVSAETKKSLLTVDCSIAPNRDALLPIMANSHFGLGDKSKWGYLGSRKAVFDEWQDGKTIAQLAKVFDRTKGQINDLIIEYLLYLEALNLKWTDTEKSVLLDPSVEFNPPVRFLQTRGHKAKMGIAYDKTNLKIEFLETSAKDRFKTLIMKLVINPEPGLGATASFEEVFPPVVTKQEASKAENNGQAPASGVAAQSSVGGTTPAASGASNTTAGQATKPGTMFAYKVTVSSNLLLQLIKEAKDLNVKKFPAAATFLLRNIVESLLKHIIHAQSASSASKSLDLEGALNLCQSNSVSLPHEDKKILKEFNKTHVNYLNLGAHGNVIPNPDRVMAARDCIDQFIKKNI